MSTPHTVEVGLDDWFSYYARRDDTRSLASFINDIIEDLHAQNVINDNGFVKLALESSNNKNRTFHCLEDISSALTKAAMKVSRRKKHKNLHYSRPTTSLWCRPPSQIDSQNEGAALQHDGLGCLTKSSVTSKSSLRTRKKHDSDKEHGRPKEPKLASELAYIAEFELSQDRGGTEQNQRRTLAGVADIMYDDPCRRFMFAFTIEDRTTRLWYLSRSHIAVAEAFNINTDPKQFIRFLLFVTFATKTELGYDPTVHRVEDTASSCASTHGSIQHDYWVNGSWYQSVEVINQSRCRDIVTSAARILKVRQVIGDRTLLPAERKLGDKVHVLKDVYLGDDARGEREIQESVLNALSASDAQDARKYFMSILADELVCCSSDSVAHTADCTGSMLRGPSEHSWEFQWDSETLREARRHHGEPVQPVNIALKDCQHRRVLFEHECKELHEFSSLKEFLQALKDVVNGLRYMRLAGYIHRDISTGNCLCYGGVTMLSDLEYGKLYASISKHDPKTGTPAYMAVEIMASKHLFAGRSEVANSWFSANFFHDLESVFWMLLEFVLSRVAETLRHRIQEPKIQYVLERVRSQGSSLFFKIDAGDRRDTIRLEDCESLPYLASLYKNVVPQLRPVILPLLVELPKLLRECYKAVESQKPDSEDAQRWPIDAFKVDYYLRFESLLGDALGALALSPSDAYDEFLTFDELYKPAAAHERPSSSPTPPSPTPATRSKRTRNHPDSSKSNKARRTEDRNHPSGTRSEDREAEVEVPAMAGTTSKGSGPKTRSNSKRAANGTTPQATTSTGRPRRLGASSTAQTGTSGSTRTRGQSQANASRDLPVSHGTRKRTSTRRSNK